MRSTILQSVRTLISDVYGITEERLKPQTDLSRDLGADSLDKLELATEMEHQFGIAITDADALRMNTVTDAARIVAAHCPE